MVTTGLIRNSAGWYFTRHHTIATHFSLPFSISHDYLDVQWPKTPKTNSWPSACWNNLYHSITGSKIPLFPYIVLYFQVAGCLYHIDCCIPFYCIEMCTDCGATVCKTTRKEDMVLPCIACLSTANLGTFAMLLKVYSTAGVPLEKLPYFAGIAGSTPSERCRGKQLFFMSKSRSSVFPQRFSHCITCPIIRFPSICKTNGF